VRADNFVKEMKKRHKEAKTVLSKLQKKMKKHANRNLKDLMEYQVRNKVLLSTNGLV